MLSAAIQEQFILDAVAFLQKHSVRLPEKKYLEPFGSTKNFYHAGKDKVKNLVLSKKEADARERTSEKPIE